jgi:hypothetical protein
MFRPLGAGWYNQDGWNWNSASTPGIMKAGYAETRANRGVAFTKRASIRIRVRTQTLLHFGILSAIPVNDEMEFTGENGPYRRVESAHSDGNIARWLAQTDALAPFQGQDSQYLRRGMFGWLTATRRSVAVLKSER